jgi:cellulose synthase/poly-beta-1,6-N-acetylglucosamine synthase-like glycosyltransferase
MEDIPGYVTDADLPGVSIMVPCYNEERTVKKTITSLLELNYPREKLTIIVIDDGSKDSTWQVVQEFASNPSVMLLQKINEGSKFSALNFGLKHVHTEIVGCLDADSRVDSEALRHSVEWFSRDDVYGVVPSMVIDSPKSIMQYMQKVEYELSTYLRQALHMMESLYVAPGPLTLFRKEVFDKLGPYKEAHHTEDLEIALRMQCAGMRLVHSKKSLVYTHGPRIWPQLLKQRVRWTYGFIKNIIDYRPSIFSGELGDLSIFILPIGFISIIISVIALPILLFNLIYSINNEAQQIIVSGLRFHAPQFNLFTIPSQAYALLGLVSLAILATTLIIARKVILKKSILSFDLATLIIYPFFSGWWSAKSLYKAILSKQDSWK